MSETLQAAYWLHVGMVIGSAGSREDLVASKPWQLDDGGVREMWHRFNLDLPGRLGLGLMLSRWTPDRVSAMAAMRELSAECGKERAVCGFLLRCQDSDTAREYGARLDPPVHLVLPSGSGHWSSLGKDMWSPCRGCNRLGFHQMVSHLDAEQCFSDHDEVVCCGCKGVLICCLCGQGDPEFLSAGASHACGCGKSYTNTGERIKVQIPGVPSQ
jgi:hypothetical protein